IGDVAIVSNSQAKEIARAAAEKDHRGGVEGENGTLQFCEKNFPKLKLIANPDGDAFGRPARTWEYDNTEIGTYTEDADLVATVEGVLTKGALYDAVGEDVAKKLEKGTADLASFVDGVAGAITANDFVSGSSAKVNEANIGNGSVTTVYLDTSGDKPSVTVCTVNVYAVKVTSNYEKKSERIQIDSLLTDGVANKIPAFIKQEDFDVSDYEKDDYLLVTYSDKAGSQGIQSVAMGKVLQGSVETYRADSSVTVKGTRYSWSLRAKAEHKAAGDLAVGNTARLLLDRQGNAIYIVSGNASGKYVYISAAGKDGPLDSAKLKAKAYFTDGTSKEIVLERVVDEENDKKYKTTGDMLAYLAAGNTYKWYTYTLSSDGGYTLFVQDNVIKEKTDLVGEAEILRSGIRFNALDDDQRAGENSVMLYRDGDGDVSVYNGVEEFPQLTLKEREEVPVVKDLDLTLVHTFKFDGSDTGYAPHGVFGKYTDYTFTPSADGGALTVVGNTYPAADVNAGQAKSYWGDVLAGETTTATSGYVLSYKMKNTSSQSSSYFALGSWITNSTAAEWGYWGVNASYESTKSGLLRTMNGPTNVTAAENQNILRTADKDADGFISVRLVYDAPSATLSVQAKYSGAWTEVLNGPVTVSAGQKMGLIFYMYRPGAISFTIKDVNLYSYVPEQEEENDLWENRELEYEVDFRGTDGTFAPAVISDASVAGYSYTPSADGKTLTVAGNDYGPSGSTAAKQTYWGGAFNGYAANGESRYIVTFKARNDSTRPNSQFAVGNWITVPTGTAKFWNITATYNSTAASILSLMNGNASAVGVDTATKNAMRDDVDHDADGFTDVRVDYDGPEGKMTVYMMQGGAWTKYATREITVGADNQMGMMLYMARTGTVSFTLKDMKLYSVVPEPAPAALLQFLTDAPLPCVLSLCHKLPRTPLLLSRSNLLLTSPY
ncbi:MAG: hypothetical protein IKN53_05305, partial [Oscillibacter sp.]|nr:hypothetical protein [Oscillibacter sp.]